MRVCLAVILAAVLLAGCSTQPSSPSRGSADQETLVAERIEAHGGNVSRDKSLPGEPVVSVALRKETVTDADVKDLKAFKQLQGLSLAHAKLTDPALKELKELKQIT